MSVSERDAIQLLTEDHREVDQIFSQLETMAPGPERDGVIQQMTRELSVHAAIEEQVLYPAVRKSLQDGDTLADEAIKEHQQVKEALAAIESAETSAEQDTLLRDLMGAVRHHVQEEENALFPKLRATLGREGGLLEMGSKLEAAKKLAPTGPHPKAPSTPPGNIVTGAAAAVTDKVRDALRRDD